MSLATDLAFVPQISYRFRNFKRKGTYLFNFSCPICGDSANQRKARGYLYRQKDALFFHCHNCSASCSFKNLIKKIDPQLHKQYLLETFEKKPEATPPRTFDIIKPAFNSRQHSDPADCPTWYDHCRCDDVRNIELPSIESLPSKHLARVYCENRLIPKKYFSELFFAEDFARFVKEIQPDNDKKLVAGEKRLVLPYYNEHNKLIGFQGRALFETKQRYIAISLEDSSKRIFGLKHVNLYKRVYVVEGPIDSLFLSNAVAAMDAALYSVIGQLGYGLEYCFIYDNEPRNKDIVRNMRKTIDMGYPVCIWPQELSNIKDINAMVLAGYSPSELQSIIDTRTFSGINANLELTQWIK